MPVKRKLEKDKTYTMLEILEHPSQAQLVGYRIRVTMQLDDSPYPRNFLAVEGVVQTGPFAGRFIHLFGVRLLRNYEKIVCSCRAYAFPHHAGKGSCFAQFEGPFCGHCGQPTEIRFVKLEPWEDINNQSRDAVVSKCCDSPVFEDAELKKEYEP